MNAMRFRIADIVFASDNKLTSSNYLEGSYDEFISYDEPEIGVYGHYNGLPEISIREEDRVFDSSTFWSFYRIQSQYVLVLRTPSPDQSPYCIALFRERFRIADIHYNIPELTTTSDGILPHPMAFPIFHITMISVLAQGYGVLVHACGVADGGRGYLFPASSTHGKTTMARLWEKKGTILNDERVVLRRNKGRLWIYGTPWHGEYDKVSPKGVPLDKIFFLNKAKANRACRQTELVSTSGFLAHCFLPFWDTDGMRFTLDFCAEVVSGIPSFMLDFRPTEDIVDFIRCVK